VNPENATFFLDYFVYNTTSPAGKTMLFDDSDTSLTYSADWQANNDSDGSLERTEHVSKAGASVALSFEGTQISVIGSSQKGFEASVVIDGSQPQKISQPQNQDQLFSSTVLSSGPHTMNIIFTEGNAAIDYFLVTSNLDIPTASTALPPTGSRASDGAQTSVSTSLGTAQVSKAPPIAAIVGGAVGGLALLLLLLVAALVWRRRSRRDNQPAFEYPVMSEPHPWADKRDSVASLTTLTEDNESQGPKNFDKQRPPSRYIYYG